MQPSGLDIYTPRCCTPDVYISYNLMPPHRISVLMNSPKIHEDLKELSAEYDVDGEPNISGMMNKIAKGELKVVDATD